MPRPGGPPSLYRYRREVEDLVRADTPFDEVEATIDEADLMPDDKAALWVLGWSMVGLEAKDPAPERPLAPVG